MATDDLNAPLGQDKRKGLLKLPVSAPQLLAGALGLSGIVVVAWAAFVNDPRSRQSRRNVIFARERLATE